MAGFRFQGSFIPGVLFTWLLPRKMTVPVLAVFVSSSVVASQCWCSILSAVGIPELTVSVHLLGNSNKSTILSLCQNLYQHCIDISVLSSLVCPAKQGPLLNLPANQNFPLAFSILPSCSCLLFSFAFSAFNFQPWIYPGLILCPRDQTCSRSLFPSTKA